MAVEKEDIKEKLQQVIDELSDHFGDEILGIDITCILDNQTDSGRSLSIIDKIYLRYLAKEEITL